MLQLETALVSIILILELSVLHKSFLELNFQAEGIISRGANGGAIKTFNGTQLLLKSSIITLQLGWAQTPGLRTVKRIVHRSHPILHHN